MDNATLIQFICHKILKSFLMKRFLIVLTVMFSTLTSAKAQTAEDSVKAVINKMFTAMNNADGASLKSCFSDSVLFQSISRTKEGRMFVRTEDPIGFADFSSKQKAGDLDEQIVFDVVKVDGPLAIAW